MSASESSPSTPWLSALRQSHQQLAGLIDPMSDDAVEAPSYDSEWSIAQVLSHLGSGAEIFSLFLDAGLQGQPAPGMEAFGPVWEVWNAKSPQDQARDAIRTDAEFIDRLEALGDAERDGWQMDMFGGEQRLADLLRLRLGEHAVHTWDVAVALDPEATVDADAVALLIDHLGQLVARAAKPPAEQIEIAVSTEEPARSFRLSVGDGAAALTPADGGAPADGDTALQLPAEALLRLVYGRLDPEHTPPLKAEGVELDTLREVFPGV